MNIIDLFYITDGGDGYTVEEPRVCPGVPLPVAAPLLSASGTVTYLVSALTRNDQTTAESPRGGETGRHTAYLPTKVFSHVLNRRAIDALNHTHTPRCVLFVFALNTWFHGVPLST